MGVELPIVSFFCAIIVLLPLPWHIKAQNVATLSLIAWLFVCNIIRGVNSAVWLNNAVMRIPVWCDITTKIIIGVSIALPACSLCITRHLEHVASARYAVATHRDKRRRQYIDLGICFGIPLLIMALHYVVQGHRFDLFEDLGCSPATYVTPPAVVILWVVPLVISLGSLVYAALAFRHFAKRRMEFEQHLKNSKSSLTTGRYMRLMALAVTEMLWGTGLGAYVLYLNIKDNDGVRPYINWANVHYHFSRVVVYERILIPDWYWGRLMMTWWVIPSTSLLFFCFFGFSEEAVEGYITMFRWVRVHIFRQTLPVRNTSASRATAPRPIRRRVVNLVSIPTFPNGLTIDSANFDTKFEGVGNAAPDSGVEAKPIEENDSVLSLSYPGPNAFDAEAQVTTAPSAPQPQAEHPYARTRDSAASTPRPLSAPAMFTGVPVPDPQNGRDMANVVKIVVEKEVV